MVTHMTLSPSQGWEHQLFRAKSRGFDSHLAFNFQEKLFSFLAFIFQHLAFFLEVFCHKLI